MWKENKGRLNMKTERELKLEKQFHETGKEGIVYIVTNILPEGAVISEFTEFEEVLHKIKLDLLSGVIHYDRGLTTNMLIEIVGKREQEDML